MKKIIICLFAIAAITVNAQNINLPAPAKKGGTSVIESLWNRHSVRTFQKKNLSNQTLSNLLWAAAGVNRKDGKRTNPTAMNKQEISVYAFMPKGVYLYDFKNHSLILKKAGDYRKLIANGQDFVNDAPVSLVMTGDMNAFSNIKKVDDIIATVALDAGIVSENINLFCASNGLATVPRITMDKAGIMKLLNLSDKQILLINNPVGYAK